MRRRPRAAFFERIVTADPGPGPDDIDEIHGSSSAAATGIEAVERIRELICTSASHDPLRDEFFLTIAGRARREGVALEACRLRIPLPMAVGRINAWAIAHADSTSDRLRAA